MKILRDKEDKKPLHRDSILQYANGDMDTVHLKQEFVLLQKKYSRLETKEKQLQKLCFDWSENLGENYEEFFKSVCTIVSSSSIKFKSAAEVVAQVCLVIYIESVVLEPVLYCK